jgi:hypothetical protein
MKTVTFSAEELKILRDIVHDALESTEAVSCTAQSVELLKDIKEKL